jgi:hypothetical protein
VAYLFCEPHETKKNSLKYTLILTTKFDFFVANFVNLVSDHANIVV